METITVSNQKGGVGKSTIAVHLAMALQEQQKQVLFVDLDPQANASKTLGRITPTDAVLASHLFRDDTITIKPQDGITLLAADGAMADIERAAPTVLVSIKTQLARLSNRFDYCVIDTPPSLGLRMTAALLVAQHVLAPIELEEYSIDGITKMLQTVFGVKEKWNPGLNFLGMLPNRFNPRSLAQKETLTHLLKSYSHLVIPARIGIRSSIPEALADGIPVWQLKKTAAREAGREFQNAFTRVFKKMGGLHP